MCAELSAPGVEYLKHFVGAGEFVRWRVWLQQKYERETHRVTPEMYYLANIVCWLRRLHIEEEKDLQVEDCLIKFEEKKPEPKTPEAKVEAHQSALKRGQSHFKRLFGIGSGSNKPKVRKPPGGKKNVHRNIKPADDHPRNSPEHKQVLSRVKRNRNAGSAIRKADE